MNEEKPTDEQIITWCREAINIEREKEAEYLYNWLGDGGTLDSVDAAELKRHIAYLRGKNGEGCEKK